MYVLEKAHPDYPPHGERERGGATPIGRFSNDLLSMLCTTNKLDLGKAM
jgi:hypothetical protein